MRLPAKSKEPGKLVADNLPYQYLSRYHEGKWRQQERIFAPCSFAPKDRGGSRSDGVVIRRHHLTIVLELRLV